MADFSDKNKDNIEGLFFVDSQCIACDACVEEAPNFFTMNDVDGHAYVYHQPSNHSDIETCQNALDLCPVNAIGKNEATKN